MQSECIVPHVSAFVVVFVCCFFIFLSYIFPAALYLLHNTMSQLKVDLGINEHKYFICVDDNINEFQLNACLYFGGKNDLIAICFSLFLWRLWLRHSSRHTISITAGGRHGNGSSLKPPEGSRLALFTCGSAGKDGFLQEIELTDQHLLQRSMDDLKLPESWKLMLDLGSMLMIYAFI